MPEQMRFEKAERKQIRLRVGLIGPSGSGKSYSALRLAKGMGGPIALIDTEGRRSELYADEFDFSVLHLEEPFSPEKYIEAIRTAEENGFKVIIIDSASHEWTGNGGILDMKSKMSERNDFTKWAKLTPRHNRFLDKIIHCSSHLIVSVRGKDQYILEENEKGKQQPKKVGVGGEQRGGFEYELLVSFLIDQESHVATVSKDNTHLFEGRYDLLTEEDGKRLIEWAESGGQSDSLLKQQYLNELTAYVKEHKQLIQEDLLKEVRKEAMAAEDAMEMEAILRNLKQTVQQSQPEEAANEV